MHRVSDTRQPGGIVTLAGSLNFHVDRGDMGQQLPLAWHNSSPASHAWRTTALLVLRIVVLAAIIGAAIMCLASTFDGRVETLISASDR